MKLFFTLIICGLCAVSRAQTVTGTVRDENKAPLEGASVMLLAGQDSVPQKTTVSGKDGKFDFSAVKPGSYRVKASAVGHQAFETMPFTLAPDEKNFQVPDISMQKQNTELQAVAIISKKPFVEQKSDRILINVDASPANAGTSVMDVLEKSPGVSVDKDGVISLKGKQGVTIMIDGRPTYMTGVQLAAYLKSLPSSAIDQLEIMSNPSAKYDAAGNSGIINIKTKKNKAKGFNGSATATYTQGVYAKPGGSLNMNYRVNKINLFLNGGYTYWQGFQNLDINRNYLDKSSGQINSIFTQNTHMKFLSPELNLKLGMDYFLDSKTTFGIVLSAYQNNETSHSQSYITLKDGENVTDSLTNSFGTIHGKWKNASVNLNFKRQFDTTGREITADLDYIYYQSGSQQMFENYTYDPNMKPISSNILSGDLPSTINIYSFKTDYTHPLAQDLKMEAGLKTSFVHTDNQANYYDVHENVYTPDSLKTNYFVYQENINAAYINFTKKYMKWNFQAGLRVENTNYSGHQYGNAYTVEPNDSTFSKSYFNAFPTVYITYELNDKNTFNLNFGRRIDRPDYGDLNPFLFFLDEYTYQAGNPYLQPQTTTNIELSHTFRGVLTTTLNYSNTQNFFAETFEQQGHATIVRRGNIGRRENGGIAVSFNKPLTKWWTTSVYLNVNYNHYTGELYGEPLDEAAVTGMANMNNQFKFNNGWSAELSGWYRSAGIEGQIMIGPMGQTSTAVAKQIWNGKASVKLGLRDIFYTQQAKGTIDFQQTQASFHNSRDSRQLSLSFTYRFGKAIKGPASRHQGGADDESSRLKKGGNN